MSPLFRANAAFAISFLFIQQMLTQRKVQKVRKVDPELNLERLVLMERIKGNKSPFLRDAHQKYSAKRKAAASAARAAVVTNLLELRKKLTGWFKMITPGQIVHIGDDEIIIPNLPTINDLKNGQHVDDLFLLQAIRAQYTDFDSGSFTRSH